MPMPGLQHLVLTECKSLQQQVPREASGLGELLVREPCKQLDKIKAFQQAVLPQQGLLWQCLLCRSGQADTRYVGP